MIIVNRDRNGFTSETLKGWNYYIKFRVNSKKEKPPHRWFNYF